MKDKNLGTLYIVGTPIGNLSDITLRAINVLKQVDIILAEDTRQTLKLLNHLEISKKMISYHKHNEQEKLEYVISLLESGKNIALVSDAGMPIISDPGENLVKYLRNNNYDIQVIPGVTAFVTGLVGSGIDATRFVFEGFLSVNKKQRKKKLELLKEETRTIIFYEAPHKILYTLQDMLEVLGNRKICIARELTKIHEEYIITNFEEAVKKIKETPIKGEIVLIVEGILESELINKNMLSLNKISNVELVKKEILNGMSKKEAIKKVAKQKGISKNDVYKECLDLGDNNE